MSDNPLYMRCLNPLITGRCPTCEPEDGSALGCSRSVHWTLHPGHGDMAPDPEAATLRLYAGMTPEQLAAAGHLWDGRAAMSQGALYRRGIAEACEIAYRSGWWNGLALGFVVAGIVLAVAYTCLT